MGIMLVVLGHNWLAYRAGSKLGPMIFSFHMPLLFFLSGVFLRQTDRLSNVVVSRFHSLLKPYLVVLAGVGAIKFIYSMTQSGGSIFGVADYIVGMCYATGNTINWTALWFLPHLFLASIVVLAVIQRIKVRAILCTCLVLSLICGVRMLRPQELPWSIDLLPITSAFLLLDWLSSSFVRSMTFRPMVFCATLFAFAVPQVSYDETMNLNVRRLNANAEASQPAINADG